MSRVALMHSPDSIRRIINICLISEVKPECLPLNVSSIYINPSDSLDSFRQEIKTQNINVPEKYVFVTSLNGEIPISQEPAIPANHLISDSIIRIRNVYDPPRIGIQNINGETLGFVFLPISGNAIEAKNVIKTQLNLYNFKFIDQNGWPILSNQEENITIWNLVVNGLIKINLQEVTPGNFIEFPPSTHGASLASKRPSFASLSAGSNTQISVMISYCRTEAKAHAVKLKKFLETMEFKVFLDIDDIPLGEDWYDALNRAINDCELFVPLVTPNYGFTEWTNREIKLADKKRKKIIPISFLEEWPPEPLAIQFSTIQFLPWKPSDQVNAHSDITVWEDRFIDQTARKISEFYNNPNIKASPSLEFKCFVEVNQSHLPLLVISVHPRDEHYGRTLKELFYDTYDVWLSCDSVDSTSIPSTPDVINLDLEEEFAKRSSQFYVNGYPPESQDSVMDGHVHGPLQIFQDRANRASALIIILTKTYCESKRSRKQAFYCQMRINMIGIQIENFEPPVWVKMFFKETLLKDFDQKGNVPQVFGILDTFKNENKIEIEKPLNANARMNTNIRALRKKLEGKLQSCVYVTGGISFNTTRTENICNLIGQKLSEIASICLVTGGFYGTCESVGRSFSEERTIKGEKPPSVYHILPVKDEKDFSKSARQNLGDKTFQKVPNGETVFIGNSVNERISIVSCVFNICILIGGEDYALREAGEFLWYDKIVIPIVSTGGAAEENFGPSSNAGKHFPCGVQEKDWSCLHDNSKTPMQVAKAVKNIVLSILSNTTNGSGKCIKGSKKAKYKK